MALEFFAGCVGGCAGVLVGHPFDTLKVRMQCQDYRNPLYRNSFDCLRHLMKNESAAGLFRGIGSPMAGVAFINAIIFGVQANIQKNLPNPNSIKSHFISGTIAGLMQSFICSPMELIKTHLQIQKEQVFKGPWHCTKHIYQNFGMRGIYRGLNVTLFREGPAFGLYFATYEYLTRTGEGTPISTAHMLLAGGTAGSASWLLAYPVDVVKSRYQVDGLNPTQKYTSATDCLIKSYKIEGIGCLFRGLNLALVRAFPVNAATFAAVTWTYRLTGHNTASFDLPELHLNPALALHAVDKDCLSRSATSLAANADAADLSYFQQFTTQLGIFQ